MFTGLVRKDSELDLRVFVQDGDEQPVTWGYPSLSLGFSSAERVSLQGNCVLSRDFL